MSADHLWPTAEPWPAPIEWSRHAKTTIAVMCDPKEIVTGRRIIAEFESEADAARAVDCVNACAGIKDPVTTLTEVQAFLRDLADNEVCESGTVEALLAKLGKDWDE